MGGWEGGRGVRGGGGGGRAAGQAGPEFERSQDTSEVAGLHALAQQLDDGVQNGRARVHASEFGQLEQNVLVRLGERPDLWHYAGPSHDSALAGRVMGVGGALELVRTRSGFEAAQRL